MKILISNDDGYLAPGLKALADALTQISDVTVVAPERNQSGASNSLTLGRPLRVYRATNGFYYVDGTPADCVHLALTGLLDDEPDMVVAGINSGENLGDDVLYSGTVAAATEGRFLGLPAIAVSLIGSVHHHFVTAAWITLTLLEHLQKVSLPSDTILNVNIPDLPLDQIQGIIATRLGHRHKAEPVIRDRSPTGDEIYWVGSAGPEADAGEGTDFWAINNGYVSVTPLQVDLTRHERLSPLTDWLTDLRLV